MSNIDKIRLSGVTYDIVDSSAVHSLEGYATTGDVTSAITAASQAILTTVAEAHYQTSGDVQNAISGKADTTAVTQSIEAAVSGKANASDVITEAFPSVDEQHNFNLSVTKNGITSSNTIFTPGSGLSVDGGTVLVDFSTVAKKSDIPAVTGYADAVAYNSTSKYVEFFHGGTGGTVVFSYDASPFLIDGMVQNVEVKTVAGSGTCLVITFNTDAGKQDINIPISQIFDASNYYTTGETDNKIAEATSGKADTSAVTAVNDVLTAHTANTDIHVTTADKTEWSGKQNALTAGTGIDITNDVISVTGVPLTVEDSVTSGSSNPVKSSGIYNFVTGETSTKQDTLVSGTNIKTVGGNSVLGSGNISIMSAHIGTGSDSTTLILDFN